MKLFWKLPLILVFFNSNCFSQDQTTYHFTKEKLIAIRCTNDTIVILNEIKDKQVISNLEGKKNMHFGSNPLAKVDSLDDFRISIFHTNLENIYFIKVIDINDVLRIEGFVYGSRLKKKIFLNQLEVPYKEYFASGKIKIETIEGYRGWYLYKEYDESGKLIRKEEHGH